MAQISCVIDGEDREPEELLRAWPTVSLVAEAAASAGAEVTVLQSARHERVHWAGSVEYRFVPEPRMAAGYGSGLAPWNLTAALRRLRPDVVHFNGLDFPLHLRAACMAGAPVLVQDHASTPRGSFRRLRRWASSAAAGIAFTSAEQARPFLATGQLPERMPVFEIPESSTRFTAGDCEQARRETGIFGDPALLWVGHLDANKDPLTILRAFAEASDQLPDAQLWCASGSAPLMTQVREMLSADMGLAGRVHLLGAVEHGQIESLCRACDLFVLGSSREGSGYALIEALACGLTPVVSDIPSFRVLCGDGAVGALVPPGDAAAFARAIVEQAQKPRRETRDSVLDHFERHLSPHALGERLVSVYQQLAKASRNVSA